jgi:hypothetical protein
VLFGAFAYFSLILFPKSKVPKGEHRNFFKQMRNFFYYLFGWGILVCIALILILWIFTDESIFWPEAIALWMFAASWLLKGRVDWTLAEAGKRTLYYARFAGELIKGSSQRKE